MRQHRGGTIFLPDDMARLEHGPAAFEALAEVSQSPVVMLGSFDERHRPTVLHDLVSFVKMVLSLHRIVGTHPTDLINPV